MQGDIDCRDQPRAAGAAHQTCRGGQQRRAVLVACLSGAQFGLTGAFLTGSFRYVNNQGIDLEDPARLLVAHVFNHQTHHRGQVHDMLSQTEVPPPSLDMHRVIKPS